MTDIDAIKAEADKGNADVQYKLAVTLREDEEASRPLVREWFQKAADQGHAEAQYVIATDFLWDEDPKRRTLLLAAAEQGHAAACMELCYFEIEFGRGETEGLKWYRRGRELGAPHAPSQLGIFAEGYKPFFQTFEEYVAEEEEKAKRGSSESQYRVGLVHINDTDTHPMDLIQGYAWIVASGASKSSWILRRLEGVFDEKELHDAGILTAEYTNKYPREPSPGPSLGSRLLDHTPSPLLWVLAIALLPFVVVGVIFVLMVDALLDRSKELLDLLRRSRGPGSRNSS